MKFTKKKDRDLEKEDSVSFSIAIRDYRYILYSLLWVYNIERIDNLNAY